MTGLPVSRVVRVLVPAVATLALVLGGAGAASAHDEVVATTPAAQAEVAAPPSAVELQVTSPPQVLGTEVRVTGPGGAVVSEGEPEVLDSTVRQPLADGLPAGTYTVDWRVISGDGHPITGTFGFTVAAGAPSSSSAAPAEVAPDPAPDAPDATTTVDPSSAASPAESSSSTGLLVGGALVVLVLAGLVTWRLRRSA